MPNITLARCNDLCPATLLAAPREENNYDCILLSDYLLTSGSDLQETLIDNADLIWFTDGSYLEDERGHYLAGCAVTSTVDIIESSYLPEAKFTQQAEQLVLIRACQLVKGNIENIYTNSCCDFGVAHDFGML